ncbi:MAG: hypothetical protein LBU15_02435 [Rickettsiales bacterium]|jgi:hypothetical protein|nr:hypothetical protein [Rickettsiales bacterium]
MDGAEEEPKVELLGDPRETGETDVHGKRIYSGEYRLLFRDVEGRYVQTERGKFYSSKLISDPKDLEGTFGMIETEVFSYVGLIGKKMSFSEGIFTEKSTNNSYAGKFEVRRPAGSTAVIYANGDSYAEGSRGRGLQGPYGSRGTLAYANGDSYLGEFRNRIPHGKGKLLRHSGTIYEGNFANGLCSGQGKLQLSQSRGRCFEKTYRGEFKNGWLYIGYGEEEKQSFVNWDGDIYRGEHSNGLPHGVGNIIYGGAFAGADGHSLNLFRGEMRNGQPWTGAIEYKSPEGSSRLLAKFDRGEMVEVNIKNPSEHIRSKDGGSFSCPTRIKDGSGKGTIEYPDGNIYSGEIQRWKPHGRGKKIYPNGPATYEGEFAGGRPQGLGTVTEGDTVYHPVEIRGNWFRLLSRSGLRLRNILDGSVYRGDCDYGIADGLGVLERVDLDRMGTTTINNISLYRGHFFCGIFRKGSVCFPNGYSYTGDFLNWQPFGRMGTLVNNESGNSYRVLFENGRLVNSFPEQSSYDVEFGDTWSFAESTRTFKDLDGQVYEGGFPDGEFSGQGRMTYPGNRYYEGDFIRGEYSGQGTMFYSGRKLYRGGFLGGKFNGRGKLTELRNRKIRVYEGEFEFGRSKKVISFRASVGGSGGNIMVDGILIYTSFNSVGNLELFGGIYGVPPVSGDTKRVCLDQLLEKKMMVFYTEFGPARQKSTTYSALVGEALEKVAKVNYSKINELLNGGIDSLSDLRKYGALEDLTKNSGAGRRGGDSSGESEISGEDWFPGRDAIHRTILGNRATRGPNALVEGFSEEKNMIMLANVKSLEELRRIRFQNIDNISYDGVTYFLETLGINSSNIDNMDEEYITVNVVTSDLKHSLCVTLDLGKIKEIKLRKNWNALDNILGVLFYIYDTARIAGLERKENIGALMKNSFIVNHRHQKSGTCWYNASATVLAIAANPDLFRGMREESSDWSLEFEDIKEFEEISGRAIDPRLLSVPDYETILKPSMLRQIQKQQELADSALEQGLVGGRPMIKHSVSDRITSLLEQFSLKEVSLGMFDRRLIEIGEDFKDEEKTLEEFEKVKKKYREELATAIDKVIRQFGEVGTGAIAIQSGEIETNYLGGAAQKDWWKLEGNRIRVGLESLLKMDEQVARAAEELNEIRLLAVSRDIATTMEDTAPGAIAKL